MSLKASAKSQSTNHLYEFAAEVANSGSLSEKMRTAADSTDATAAKNAAARWKQVHGQTDPLA